jgi:DNA topoisomerase-1
MIAADIDAIVALHEDPQRCAEAAGLRYVSADEPGLTRRRCGRGFRYLDASGTSVSRPVRSRIESLAIPPAWRDVWVCTDESAHLLATGADERGRRQYLYHPQWRAFRDIVNFYRLGHVGRTLPALRADIDRQLRRRTLDRDVVVAAMLRIIDACGLRVGNEVYAEENDSFGLCTLTRRHVCVDGSAVQFRFPAKSGKRADLILVDARVARIVGRLREQRSRRLFTIDRSAVDADELNERLGRLCGPHVSAKDFRTWHGTTAAYRVLRERLAQRGEADPGTRERDVLDAVDAAAEALGNTRAVARSHYVHPHLLEAHVAGELAELRTRRPVPAAPGMADAERELLALLDSLLEARLAAALR